MLATFSISRWYVRQLALLVTGCLLVSTGSSMKAENPLLSKSPLFLEAPVFSDIKVEHYKPAFEVGMAEQKKEIEAIANSTEKPTFDNTLVAMERTGETLKRVAAIFFNLTNSHTSPELQAVEEEIAPILSSHFDDINLNKKLFARMQAIWNDRNILELNEEQKRLLEEQYQSFVRAGAMLDDAAQQRVRQINEEMSKLTTQFQNNLLAATKERAVIVDDVKQLDGMSDAEIAAAAEAAKQKGQEGKYLISITNTTRQPILTSLKNRDLRKKVWEASAYRAMGQNGGVDNRPLVIKLAKLRAEKATLLGFASHAEYALQNQMAKKPEAAFKMLSDLVPQVLAKAKAESKEIQEFMNADGVAGDVQPWDWEYYAEKVRKAKYDFDESLIKPYFELDSVLKNGVFYTFGRLYNVSFRERTDLPVYCEGVRVFDVLNKDGSVIGVFYADYIERDSKRGGAWMDSFVNQSRLLGQKPVVVNVMNISKAAPGEPVLMSLDQVQTMFHELGHGVHGLFSKVEYPTLSGTSVPRDFVEFPSTVHEDWAIDPVVLKNYARHYKTGETIPQEMLERAIAASKFNKGFDTLEYLSAALLDLGWHSMKADDVPTSPEDVEKTEAALLAKYGVNFAPVPPRYRTQYFAHVWSGGYSAGYYAYLWSEVLAADAFAYMATQGGLESNSGMEFREKILSRGATREVMQQYRDFRGSDPKVEALLERRGLK
ncbi:MAG: M3 family metallopeptidase [Planctomycetes bacterium]|nr:M3 family metallopeptidase [Planctomycetota bacterium]